MIKLDGSLPAQPSPGQGPLTRALTLPGVRNCLAKAAHDPRIPGVVLRVGQLSSGWATLQELREAIHSFQKESDGNKFSIATLEQASEKEMYIASACEELYAISDSSTISLTGLSVQGTFLRGALDKAGIEPQVQRLGEYKSAGDQFLRKDMSDAQREQLAALLDDIYYTFIRDIASSRNKTEDDVHSLIDRGVQDVQHLKHEGWIDGVVYRDEIRDLLKPRTGDSRSEAPQVSYSKYVQAPAAIAKRPKQDKKDKNEKETPSLGVLHLSGAIVGGSSRQGSNGNIAAEDTIDKVRKLRNNSNIKAVVVRISSPGGDAFASELMWRELQLLGRQKPVVASMLDTAASGGYFLSMACSSIFAYPLTLTGSIGVVLAQFNFGELYSKIGYSKTFISRGRYAEVTADNRSFTDEEEQFQQQQALRLYQLFRNLAARCRGQAPEEMETRARGRVWSGKRAIDEGLVDQLGSLEDAIKHCKTLIGYEREDDVNILDFGQLAPDPSTLLASGNASVPKSGWMGSVFRQVLLPLLSWWHRMQTCTATNALGDVRLEHEDDIDVAGVSLSSDRTATGRIGFSSRDEDLFT